MSKASDMNGTLPCLLCGDVKKSDYLGLGEVTSHVQAHPLCIKFAKEIHNKKSIVAVGKTRLQVFFHKIHFLYSYLKKYKFVISIGRTESPIFICLKFYFSGILTFNS